MMDTAIYMTSKHRVNPTQFIISVSGSPARICPVMRTDPMTMGTINGYSRIGSMTSRVLRFTDREDRSVPIAQNPSVPTKIT